jgi:hypothetical protein
MKSPFFRLKDHHQNAGHEIDQVGSYRYVDRHGDVVLSNPQVQKL